MQYQYLAVNTKNRKTRGQITANDKAEAISLLQEQGLIALELTAAGGSDAEADSIWSKQLGSSDIHNIKIPKKQLMTMLHQMGIMMKSGVSLSTAMSVLIDGERDKRIKKVLLEINDDFFTGTALSVSMAKFRAFPEIVVNILQSGETNGRLDTAFERCADILQKELLITSKIRNAMGYPTFLLALTILLMIIMNAMVLPNFALVFEQFGSDLPALTKNIMAISNFLTTWWYLVVLGIAAFIITFYLLKKRVEAFSTAVDRMMLKIPVIGTLLRQSYIARFCRTMSSLVESGVEIVRAIEISSKVIPNKFMRSQLKEVTDDVRIGSAISTSMAKYRIFDPLLVSMVQVGEESGMLFETMEKMADLYENQTDDSAKRLTTMLEPAMTIIIAVIVGTVIVSIVMPMFGMYSVVAGGN